MSRAEASRLFSNAISSGAIRAYPPSSDEVPMEITPNPEEPPEEIEMNGEEFDNLLDVEVVD